MTSVKVRYIGAKDLKEDNVAGTGTVWIGNGDVKPVPLDAWAKMSRHTTVWELVAEGEEPQPKRTLVIGSAPKAEVLAAIPEALPVAAPAAAPDIVRDTPAQEVCIDIGGSPVGLARVIARAQASSGLTDSEWNELGEDDRNDFIATEIEVMREEDAEAKAKVAAEALANSPKPTAEELAAGKPTRAARGTGKRAKAAKGEES